MQDGIEQDLCLKQLFIKVKGQVSIDSQESVLECTEFLNNNPVEKFVISHSQKKLIAIEEEQYIKQFKVQNLKRDFVFKSGHNNFSTQQLEFTKNHNYFYFCNGRGQLRYFQTNNSKIKQISSMRDQKFNYLRQIFVDDENFLFVAIPSYIQQYCKYTKQVLKHYQIDHDYHCENCFDFSIKDRLLVSQSFQSIKVWFIEENSLITKQIESNYSISKYLRLNQRYIYKLQLGFQDQFFMLWIYKITEDNKKIVTVNSIRMDDYFQFVCIVYSTEKIYTILQNYDFTNQECQSFSIQQIDNQYKYLAIIEKQIYIRNKNFNNITNEFLTVK